VAVPLKYGADITWPASVIGTAHGFLYMAYLVTVLDLGLRMRWHILRLLLVAVAGTVPFLSFVAERKITELVRGRATP
jgi:integral membrane protein